MLIGVVVHFKRNEFVGTQTMFVHIFTGTTLQGITPSTRPLVIGEGNTRVPLSDVMALIVGISKLMDNFGCWIELGILSFG